MIKNKKQDNRSLIFNIVTNIIVNLCVLITISYSFVLLTLSVTKESNILLNIVWTIGVIAIIIKLSKINWSS